MPEPVDCEASTTADRRGGVRGFLGVLRARTGHGTVARGGVWLGAGSAVEQVLRFTRNMIVARVLAPEAFALMAMVNAISQFFEAFNRLGVKEAIIHDARAHDPGFLSSAWFYGLGRGIVLYAAAFVAAPLMTGLYGMPDLAAIVRLTFLGLIFRGTMSPESYVAMKRMDFGRWVLVEQGGGAVGLVAAIALTLVLRNVWALAIGLTIEAFARTVLSYMAFPFAPTRRIAGETVRSFLSYAMSAAPIPLLTYIYTRADIFVVGKLCSERELGVYGMALTLTTAPALILSRVVSPLLMPAFSRIQDRKEQLNRVLTDVTDVIAFLGVPLMAFAATFGSSTISVVYSPVYAALPAAFALAFGAAMLMNLNVPVVAIYLAIGRPRLLLGFTSFRAALVVALIYFATRAWGPAGAAGTLAVAMLGSYILQMRSVHRLTGLNERRYWWTVGRHMFASLLLIPWGVASRLLLGSREAAMLVSGCVGLFVVYVVNYKAWGFRARLRSLALAREGNGPRDEHEGQPALTPPDGKSGADLSL